MAAALTRAALQDELGVQQEIFQRAVEEMGARVQRELREELRRCSGAWEDETLRAPRSSWGPVASAARHRPSLVVSEARGLKEGGPAEKGARAPGALLEAPSDEAAEGEAEAGSGAAARPAAALPGRLGPLGWASSSPAAAHRPGPTLLEADLSAGPQLLPGQAEEPRPKPRLGADARRASTFSVRNSATTTVSMGEGWSETFPNDLRLPSSLKKNKRLREARRCSVVSRRDSLESASSGATSNSKHCPDSPAGGGILPVPMSSRRPSFLSTRLGMEDLVISEEEKIKPIKWIVYHPLFDLAVVVMIILNGLLIGVQTDVMARRVSDEVPPVLRIAEVCFCAAFVVELLLRFIVERIDFFRGPERAWNIFDLAVVALQLAEEVLGIVASVTGTENHAAGKNLGLVRMLRALRLVRIIRIMRILRLISELRTIVMSIASSMKHLFWTLVLLLMLVYLFSVPLTQIVLDHRLANAEMDLSELTLCWDSLGRSALTLFEAIFGGIDWDDAVMPLVTYVHLLLAPAFCAYIVFALLALMNVVTGVFVEAAIDSANRDKEKYLVQIARDLFEKADPDCTGVITWGEFEKQLDNPELQQYFKGLGVDAVSARSLFRILDLDNSGAIDADELLTGTLRLRGGAKAIDLAALIYESRRMSRRFQAHAVSLDDALNRLGGLICQVSPALEAAWEGPRLLETESELASP